MPGNPNNKNKNKNINKKTLPTAAEPIEATEFSLLETNSDELLREGKLSGRKAADKNTEKADTVSDSSEDDKKGRGRLIYILCVAGISVLLAVIVMSRLIMVANENLVFELSIGETDLVSASDAVYSANYKTSHLSASVDVTVVSGVMTDIVLTDYTGIDPKRAGTVIESVLKYQMLNVPDDDGDDIGSQTTDIIVLKAIEKALRGAVQ